MVKPETVFKVGAVRASVFRNTIEKNGQLIPLPKVAIEVRYKDKTGKWQGTNSLSLNDLPKAILALQKAYEYLMEHKGAAKEEGDRIIESARDTIKNEKLAAITEIKNQVATLSIEIAEKIVKEKLSADDKQKALVDGLVEEINLN